MISKSNVKTVLYAGIFLINYFKTMCNKMYYYIPAVLVGYEPLQAPEDCFPNENVIKIIWIAEQLIFLATFPIPLLTPQSV